MNTITADRLAVPEGCPPPPPPYDLLCGCRVTPRYLDGTPELHVDPCSTDCNYRDLLDFLDGMLPDDEIDAHGRDCDGTLHPSARLS